MATIGKKFDTSPEMHAAVKAYCKRKDIRVKHWVDRVLNAALLDAEKIERVMTNFASAKALSSAPFWEKPSRAAAGQPVAPVGGLCPICEHAWPGCVCGTNPDAKPYKGKGK